MDSGNAHFGKQNNEMNASPLVCKGEVQSMVQTQAIYKTEIGCICAKDALMCPSVSLSPSAHPTLGPVFHSVSPLSVIITSARGVDGGGGGSRCP